MKLNLFDPKVTFTDHKGTITTLGPVRVMSIGYYPDGLENVMNQHKGLLKHGGTINWNKREFDLGFVKFLPEFTFVDDSGFNFMRNGIRSYQLFQSGVKRFLLVHVAELDHLRGIADYKEYVLSPDFSLFAHTEEELIPFSSIGATYDYLVTKEGEYLLGVKLGYFPAAVSSYVDETVFKVDSVGIDYHGILFRCPLSEMNGAINWLKETYPTAGSFVDGFYIFNDSVRVKLF